MKKILVCVAMLITGVSACKKDKFGLEKLALADDQKIQEFITSKNITAIKHPSGLYYVVSNAGWGNITYTVNTSITVKYTGRRLNGSIFEQGTITYPIGGLIGGWQIGVPLIQKGGKIRLIIPSALAYGTAGQGSIPPNTVLDFDIELLNVTN